MGTILSRDGTKIAYDKTGQGPALIKLLPHAQQQTLDRLHTLTPEALTPVLENFFLT